MKAATVLDTDQISGFIDLWFSDIVPLDPSIINHRNEVLCQATLYEIKSITTIFRTWANSSAEVPIMMIGKVYLPLTL